MKYEGDRAQDDEKMLDLSKQSEYPPVSNVWPLQTSYINNFPNAVSPNDRPESDSWAGSGDGIQKTNDDGTVDETTARGCPILYDTRRYKDAAFNRPPLVDNESEKPEE